MAKRKQAAGGIVGQEYELVPLKALQPHPRNVNEGDVGAIVTSIQANQFFGAVVAQKSSGYILAGKHRWIGAQECGLEVIPVIWAGVDDATALRIMLADNRTARLGHDNEPALADLLQEMLATQGTLEGTGFDGEDLEQMMADLANPSPGAGDTPSSNSPAEGNRVVTCPSCGHEFRAEL
jgi:ParB-like chromosome segregation protein Spo0J